MTPGSFGYFLVFSLTSPLEQEQLTFRSQFLLKYFFNFFCEPIFSAVKVFGFFGNYFFFSSYFRDKAKRDRWRERDIHSNFFNLYLFAPFLSPLSNFFSSLSFSFITYLFLSFFLLYHTSFFSLSPLFTLLFSLFLLYHTSFFSLSFSFITLLFSLFLLYHISFFSLSFSFIHTSFSYLYHY